MKNHGKGLHRIAEEGGLTVAHALRIIDGKQFTPFDDRGAVKAEDEVRLSLLAAKWNNGQ